MKCAREMFKELGYRFEETEHISTGEIMDWNYHYLKYDGDFKWEIHFNNSSKLMHTSCELFNKTIDFTCYTPALLKAIQQQLKELGWEE